MGIWRLVGYTPNRQQRVIHADAARFKLVAGGERAGKSYSAAMELVHRCNVPDGLFWIVGPDYEQTKAEFDYTMEALTLAGAVVHASVPDKGQRSVVTKWGARIETKTSDDVRKLASKATHGALMVEAAQQGYDVWRKLRGRVAQTRGWVLASGTFEGSLGWYPDTWKRWQGDNPEGGRSFSLPTWSNKAIFPGGRNDPEILALEATYPPDLFSERFGAVPCPPAGLVFREFSFEEHVSDTVTFEPDLPVHLAIDPGYAGAYAVLALQEEGGFVTVIDEVYESFMVGPDVIEECKRREWWPAVVAAVMDIAGRQHHAQKSQLEIWRDEAEFSITENKVGIVDGIARTRTFLRDPSTAQPRILFASHLRNTFDEFGKYRYPQTVEGKPVTELPVDSNNHALKALAYWLFAKFGPVEGQARAPDLGSDRFAPVMQPVAPREAMTLEAGEEPGTLRFVAVRRPSARARAFGR